MVNPSHYFLISFYKLRAWKSSLELIPFSRLCTLKQSSVSSILALSKTKPQLPFHFICTTSALPFKHPFDGFQLQILLAAMFSLNLVMFSSIYCLLTGDRTSQKAALKWSMNAGIVCSYHVTYAF